MRKEFDEKYVTKNIFDDVKSRLDTLEQHGRKW
jgi:hypothetical protein